MIRPPKSASKRAAESLGNLEAGKWLVRGGLAYAAMSLLFNFAVGFEYKYDIEGTLSRSREAYLAHKVTATDAQYPLRLKDVVWVSKDSTKIELSPKAFDEIKKLREPVMNVQDEWERTAKPFLWSLRDIDASWARIPGLDFSISFDRAPRGNNLMNIAERHSLVILPHEDAKALPELRVKLNEKGTYTATLLLGKNLKRAQNLEAAALLLERLERQEADMVMDRSGNYTITLDPKTRKMSALIPGEVPPSAVLDTGLAGDEKARLAPKQQ